MTNLEFYSFSNIDFKVTHSDLEDACYSIYGKYNVAKVEILYKCRHAKGQSVVIATLYSNDTREDIIKTEVNWLLNEYRRER